MTDYFSLSDEEERMHRKNLVALKEEQGIADDEFYHYDTPLTVKHETEALFEAGFSFVEVLNNWGSDIHCKSNKAAFFSLKISTLNINKRYDSIEFNFY